MSQMAQVPPPTPPPSDGPKPAPNPFTKDLTDTSKPPVHQAEAGPVPAIGAESSAGMKQKHKLMIIGGVVVGFFLLIVGIPLAVLNNQTATGGFTPTPSPEALTNNAKRDAQSRSDLTQKLYLKATTTTRTAYNLTLRVPTSWSATLATKPEANYPWESSLLGTAMLTRYSPLSSANPSAPASNYLAIIDVTDWLNIDKNRIPFPASTKKGWFNALTTVTPENAANTGSAIANPRIASEPGGRQNLTYIESADKQLKGISYVTLLDASVYDPQIITMMAGTLDKRSVVIFAVHGVRDRFWTTLTDLKASSDPSYGEELSQRVAKFKANDLAEDTKAIHQELLDAIDSLKMTKIGQESGTVEQ